MPKNGKFKAPYARLPFHTHVGPGNTVDKTKLTKDKAFRGLDKAAYEHDVRYGDKNIKTADADNEFIGEGLKQLSKNPLSGIATGAIAAKKYLIDKVANTDKYFRPETMAKGGGSSKGKGKGQKRPGSRELFKHRAANAKRSREAAKRAAERTPRRPPPSDDEDDEDLHRAYDELSEGGDEGEIAQEEGVEPMPGAEAGATLGGGDGTQTAWKTPQIRWSVETHGPGSRSYSQEYFHHIPINLEKKGIECFPIPLLTEDPNEANYYKIGTTTTTTIAPATFAQETGETIHRNANELDLIRQVTENSGGRDLYHANFVLDDSWHTLPFGNLAVHLDDRHLKSAMHTHAGFRIKKLWMTIEGTKFIKNTTLQEAVQKAEVSNVGFEVYADVHGALQQPNNCRSWETMMNMNAYMEDPDPNGATALSTPPRITEVILQLDNSLPPQGKRGLDVTPYCIKNYQKKGGRFSRRDALCSFDYAREGDFFQSVGWQAEKRIEWTPTEAEYLWGEDHNIIDRITVFRSTLQQKITISGQNNEAVEVNPNTCGRANNDQYRETTYSDKVVNQRRQTTTVEQENLYAGMSTELLNDVQDQSDIERASANISGPAALEPAPTRPPGRVDPENAGQDHTFNRSARGDRTITYGVDTIYGGYKDTDQIGDNPFPSRERTKLQAYQQQQDIIATNVKDRTRYFDGETAFTQFAANTAAGSKWEHPPLVMVRQQYQTPGYQFEAGKVEGIGQLRVTYGSDIELIPMKESYMPKVVGVHRLHRPTPQVIYYTEGEGATESTVKWFRVQGKDPTSDRHYTYHDPEACHIHTKFSSGDDNKGDRMTDLRQLRVGTSWTERPHGAATKKLYPFNSDVTCGYTDNLVPKMRHENQRAHHIVNQPLATTQYAAHTLG